MYVSATIPTHVISITHPHSSKRSFLFIRPRESSIPDKDKKEIGITLCNDAYIRKEKRTKGSTTFWSPKRKISRCETEMQIESLSSRLPKSREKIEELPSPKD